MIVGKKAKTQLIFMLCTYSYCQGLKGKRVAKEDDGDDEIKGILQVFRVFKLARIFKLARKVQLNE